MYDAGRWVAILWIVMAIMVLALRKEIAQGAVEANERQLRLKRLRSARKNEQDVVIVAVIIIILSVIHLLTGWMP